MLLAKVEIMCAGYMAKIYVRTKCLVEILRETACVYALQFEKWTCYE